jgi:hypothetical protein
LCFGQEETEEKKKEVNKEVKDEMDEEKKKEEEEEEEWTMDNLLGFGRFHHFQIWVVQTVVAIIGKGCLFTS